jgi:hypothetical protein
MDRINELQMVVRREVADYNNVVGLKSKSYYLEDLHAQVYVVLDVPESVHPLVDKPAIVVMARIVGDTVVIDEDITDRPLYKELERCGIPRAQIVLMYAGETLPNEAATTE